jgi:hypothetical protein
MNPRKTQSELRRGAELRPLQDSPPPQAARATTHSPFGGSAAARVLRCPASVGLIAKVPAYLRKPSAYADRGTALHEAMALLLDDDAAPLESFAGKTFGAYTITTDDVENALHPAFTYIIELLDGAEFYPEHCVTFPGVANTFGTLDLLARIDRTIYVLDFKFGSGVRVLALYPAGEEDVLNAQLMFYAAAARHSLPEFFSNVTNIVLTIIQPVSAELDAEMVSSVEVTHTELDEFITVYRAACEEALSTSPRLEKGTHCKFCPARPICPEHTKPLLDLAKFAVPAPTLPTKEAYLQALADGLKLVDATKGIRTALHDQAKRALESGDTVAGYALSAGRAERHWRDNAPTTIAALMGLGFARDDVVAEELRSVKQTEIRAKARGLKVPQELIVSIRSGTALVRAENVRVPVPQRDELMRTFSEAIATFQGEKLR